jgi:hypothetical protein
MLIELALFETLSCVWEDNPHNNRERKCVADYGPYRQSGTTEFCERVPTDPKTEKQKAGCDRSKNSVYNRVCEKGAHFARNGYRNTGISAGT